MPKTKFVDFKKPFKKTKGKCCTGVPQKIPSFAFKPLEIVGKGIGDTINKTFKRKK